MIPFPLDTDTLTLYQKGHPLICQRCASHPGTVGVTIISVEEEVSGWYTRLRRSRSRTDLAKVYQRFTDFMIFINRLTIVSFTEPAILRYEHLRTLNLNVGKMDLRIAATVLENAATLVTRNLRDFQRVPGLAVVDWSA
jgi:tRNA(fMet)-specific endonuclease VapC